MSFVTNDKSQKGLKVWRVCGSYSENTKDKSQKGLKDINSGVNISYPSKFDKSQKGLKVTIF